MKNKLKTVCQLSPLPVALVGAMVNGKPNFCTIGNIGVLNESDPVYISLGMSKINYTNIGIRQNRMFSINIPSSKLIAETDYCGMISGIRHDKASLFNLFYGRLESIPMIRDCPLNMECGLFDVIQFKEFEVFIGEVIETYADEEILTDGVVDIRKVDPILFDGNRKYYCSVGDMAGKCWSVGSQIKKEREE